MEMICTKCREPYDVPGALIFSPPQSGTEQGAICTKHHICPTCWQWLHAELNLADDNIGYRFTQVSSDDWEGLYDNGILVDEGHHIQHTDLHRCMGDAPMSQLQYRTVTAAYTKVLHERGNLPRALIDVELEDK
jgi:hypothetical protein